jgi:organic radical activating enzyme
MTELALTPDTVLDGRNFRLFETRGYRVLFRSDGVVLTLSEPLFRYLGGGEHSEEARRSMIREEFGVGGLEHLDRGLQGLHSSGILDFVPPAEPTHHGAEPGGVLLMVTQTCNLACSYCYGDGGTYGGRTKLLPVATAQAAIDGMIRRAPNRRTFNVAFFGGEPLINFRTIQEVVAYCRAEESRTDKRFSYSITTNATLVTDEVVSFFKEHRFSVMVSFDGFDAPEEQRPFRDGRISMSWSRSARVWAFAESLCRAPAKPRTRYSVQVLTLLSSAKRWRD